MASSTHHLPLVGSRDPLVCLPVEISFQIVRLVHLDDGSNSLRPGLNDLMWMSLVSRSWYSWVEDYWRRFLKSVNAPGAPKSLVEDQARQNAMAEFVCYLCRFYDLRHITPVDDPAVPPSYIPILGFYNSRRIIREHTGDLDFYSTDTYWKRESNGRYEMSPYPDSYQLLTHRIACCSSLGLAWDSTLSTACSPIESYKVRNRFPGHKNVVSYTFPKYTREYDLLERVARYTEWIRWLREMGRTSSVNSGSSGRVEAELEVTHIRVFEESLREEIKLAWKKVG